MSRRSSTEALLMVLLFVEQRAPETNIKFAPDFLNIGEEKGEYSLRFFHSPKNPDPSLK